MRNRFYEDSASSSSSAYEEEVKNIKLNQNKPQLNRKDLQRKRFLLRDIKERLANKLRHHDTLSDKSDEDLGAAFAELYAE